MSINIKKDGKLVKIAPTSYNELTDLPNIESSGDVTYITDESGKNVATIGPGGLSTTGIVVDSITLDGEDVGTRLDEIKGEIDFNDLTNNPISDNNDGTVSFADESGNKIVLIDSEGVTSVEFKADKHKLTEKADQSYVEDQITRLEASAFSGDYNDLENAPIINDTTGSAVFADEQGNQIAKIDAEGVTSVEFIAGTHKLTNKAEKDALLADFTEDSEHQTVTSAEKTYWSNKSEFSGKFGDLTDSPIIDDNSGELIYTDGTNTIVKIDASGITTTNVAIKEGDVATLIGEKADQTSLDATNDAVDVLENKVSINEEKLEGVQASDGEFTITDGTNIGMKLDSEGLLHVKEVEVAGGRIDERLKDIENYFSTEEDADSNLNKWHEIVDFLNGFEETDQVLENIIATKASNDTVNALDAAYKAADSKLQADINTRALQSSLDSTNQEVSKIKEDYVTKVALAAEVETDLLVTDAITLNDNEFIFADASGNKIAEINNVGVTSVEFVAGEHRLTDKADLTVVEEEDKKLSDKITALDDSIKKSISTGSLTVSGTISAKTIVVDGENIKDFMSDNYVSVTNPTAFGNVSFGRKSQSTIGNKSVVIGNDSVASAENSIAIGSGSTASGANSTVIGSGSIASGLKSVALGEHNTASGEYSFATGCWTTSNGIAGTTLGNASMTNANSWCALSSGIHTEARGLVQHVFGMNNIPDAAVDSYSKPADNILIVGNGDYLSENKYQSNAMELDWDGNAWFAGDVYVGSASGTNKDGGSIKLAKEATTLDGYGITDAYTKSEIAEKVKTAELEADNIVLNQNVYQFADASGNKIAEINSTGITSTDFVAGSHQLTKKADLSYVGEQITTTNSTITSTASAIRGEFAAKDTELSNKINAVETNYKSADEAIKKAYVAADTVVENKITALDNSIKTSISTGDVTATGTITANKIITDDFELKQDSYQFADSNGNKIAEISSNGLSTTKVQISEGDVATLINNKVDTQTFNNTVNNINSKFNDYVTNQTASDMQDLIDGLDGELDAVSGRISTVEKIFEADQDKVINKWDEIVTFLDGLDSTTDLDGLLAAKANQTSLNATDEKVEVLEGYFDNGIAKTAINLASAPSLTADGDGIKVTVGDKTSSVFTVPYATNTNHAATAGSATSASIANEASKVTNEFKVQVDGSDSISFDGSEVKTINLKAGNNISLTKDGAGNITITGDVQETDLSEVTGQITILDGKISTNILTNYNNATVTNPTIKLDKNTTNGGVQFKGSGVVTVSSNAKGEVTIHSDGVTVDNLDMSAYLTREDATGTYLAKEEASNTYAPKSLSTTVTSYINSRSSDTVSLNGETLTVTINGTTKSLTNTNDWRPISNKIDGTSETTSASEKAVASAYSLANGKYSKPSTGIPETDLDSDVQASLGKADTALQSSSLRSSSNASYGSTVTSTADRQYAVVKDKDGYLSVNVPWEKVTLDAGSLPGLEDALGDYITKAEINNYIPVLGGGNATTADATIIGGVTVSNHTVNVAKKTIKGSGIATVTGDASNITINVPAPSIGDGTVTIKQNGTNKGSFTLNQSGNVTIDLTDSTYSATDANPTLTWGSKSKVATVCGTDIHVTMPDDPNTHYISKNVVGTSSTATVNGAVTGTGGVYLNHLEESAVKSTHKIVGAGTVNVTSDSNGNITITGTNTNTDISCTEEGHYDPKTEDTANKQSAGSGKYISGIKLDSNKHVIGIDTGSLPTFAEQYKGTVTSITAGTGLNGNTISDSGTISLKIASKDEIGGIRTNYTQNGKNYPVSVDTNGNAYVNVPWAEVTPDTLPELTAYKKVQSAVTNPTSSSGNTTTFIDTLTQDAQGVISYTKKSIDLSNYKQVQSAISANASGNGTKFIDTISQNTNGEIDITTKDVIFPVKDVKVNGATVVNSDKVANITIDKSLIEGLGFKTADNNSVTGITVGTSGTTVNNATSNPYIKIKDDSTHRGQIQLKGTGTVTVSSDANGVITINSTGVEAGDIDLSGYKTKQTPYTFTPVSIDGPIINNISGFTQNENGEVSFDIQEIDLSEYKTKHETFDMLSGNGIKFVDTVSQNENGKINVTVKEISTASTEEVTSIAKTVFGIK